MLNIIFGDNKNSIYHPPTYFDNQYEDDWIIHPLSVEMIKDVDKSEVKSPHLIESPVLGPISPKEISGGVKTLILMAFDDTGNIFNASSCGDNCAKWIVEIGRKTVGPALQKANGQNNRTSRSRRFTGIHWGG